MKELTQQGDLEVQLNYESQRNTNNSRDELTQHSIESQEQELKKRKMSNNPDLLRTLNQQSPRYSNLNALNGQDQGDDTYHDTSTTEIKMKVKRASNIQVDD